MVDDVENSSPGCLEGHAVVSVLADRYSIENILVMSLPLLWIPSGACCVAFKV